MQTNKTKEPKPCGTEDSLKAAVLDTVKRELAFTVKNNVVRSMDTEATYRPRLTI